MKEIKDTANRILLESPDAVVKFLLLKDVLKLPKSNKDIQKAKKLLLESQHFKDLMNEQREDGSWGAFHSRSSQINQKIRSTEVGVERSLALGLDSSHSVLKKATNYILNVMRGKITFPDYQEKNDRWQTGVRLFLASTLSLIHPRHLELNRDRKLWHAILVGTFKSGKYNQLDEIKAHQELTGASVKNSYLLLNGKYQVNIIGSAPGLISKELGMKYLKWLWKRPNGIGYLGIPLNQKPLNKPGYVDRWLTSLELLARSFPCWIYFSKGSINWLWKQRNENGYWDFGPRPDLICYLPLSYNWRKSNNRIYDWTARILILLRKYYDDIRRV